MAVLGLNCLKAAEPLLGDILLFTNKFPRVPGTDVKVFVGIRIIIPENTFHFLKCQRIKNNF